MVVVLVVLVISCILVHLLVVVMVRVVLDAGLYSAGWPLLAELSRELLGVLEELLAVLLQLLGQIGAQRMLRLRVVHQRNQRVEHFAGCNTNKQTGAS